MSPIRQGMMVVFSIFLIALSLGTSLGLLQMNIWGSDEVVMNVVIMLLGAFGLGFSVGMKTSGGY